MVRFLFGANCWVFPTWCSHCGCDDGNISPFHGLVDQVLNAYRGGWPYSSFSLLCSRAVTERMLVVRGLANVVSRFLCAGVLVRMAAYTGVVCSGPLVSLVQSAARQTELRNTMPRFVEQQDDKAVTKRTELRVSLPRSMAVSQAAGTSRRVSARDPTLFLCGFSNLGHSRDALCCACMSSVVINFLRRALQSLSKGGRSVAGWVAAWRRRRVVARDKDLEPHFAVPRLLTTSQTFSLSRSSNSCFRAGWTNLGDVHL